MTQPEAFQCRFSCGQAFICEYSGFRHEVSQTCPNQPGAVDTMRINCPDELKKRCREINDNNTAMLIWEYIQSYEKEHASYQFRHNPNSLECYTCELGFESRGLYVRHLIRAIRSKQYSVSLTLSLSNFLHYLTLEKKGFIWTIPQRYISVNAAAGQFSEQEFSSNELLKTAYAHGNRGHHLIFFFEASEQQGFTCTLQNRLKFIKNTIEFLRRTGRIRGHIPVVIIETESTKAKLMPSFFGDLEAELNFISVW